MFRHTLLISTSNRCTHRHLLVTIKQPNFPVSEDNFKSPLFATSSARLFKLWMKDQMIVRTFFITTNCHRCHFHFFKLFSPQLNDHIDSDSFSITLLIHLLIQNFRWTRSINKRLKLKKSRLKSLMFSTKQT